MDRMEMVLLASVTLQLASMVASVTELVLADFRTVTPSPTEYDDLILQTDIVDMVLKWIAVLCSIISTFTIIAYKLHNRLTAARFLGKPLFYLVIQHITVCLHAARLIYNLWPLVQHRCDNIDNYLHIVRQNWCLVTSLLCAILSAIVYIGCMLYFMIHRLKKGRTRCDDALRKDITRRYMYTNFNTYVTLANNSADEKLIIA